MLHERNEYPQKPSTTYNIMAPIVLSANKQVTRESLRKQVEKLEKELATEKWASIVMFIFMSVAMFVVGIHSANTHIDRLRSFYAPIINSCYEDNAALESRSLVVGGMWLW